MQTTILTIKDGRIQRVEKVRKQVKKKFNLVLGVKRTIKYVIGSISEFFGVTNKSDQIWFYGFYGLCGFMMFITFLISQLLPYFL
ncbi:DUF3961 domain-containing protein [Bacillus cereus group sp. Bc015]|uniref:DUF3961 domain-containing protein n=1 Tax=Bacillus cereus group sp. Bc015 TaxID=3018123 RepID=UPI0022E4E850|nr:DUF3961 domain-containing protein [Bacillus cereus group sp. Bc015]MDA2738403.1 DUF3961 domain-containing protein [Bacillus cereus group sp. Bc015]